MPVFKSILFAFFSANLNIALQVSLAFSKCAGFGYEVVY